MDCIDLRDHGPMPYVVNIQEAAKGKTIILDWPYGQELIYNLP